MEFVFSADDCPEILDALLLYAEPRIGCTFDRKMSRAIGVLCEHGKAVVVYTEQRPGISLSMHVAAEGHWCSRTALKVFFAYPFLDLGMQRVTGFVERGNKTARRLNEKLGFKLEGCMRHAAAGNRDLIIYGMLRRDCRWLKGLEDGQGRTAAA